MMVVVVVVVMVVVVVVEAQIPGPSSSRVMVLQEQGKPSDRTYSRLLTPFPALPAAFTLCYRLLLYRYREEGTLLSYALDNRRDNHMRIDHRIDGIWAAVSGAWINTQVPTPAREWAHFCLSLHTPSGNWTIFLDGVVAEEGVVSKGVEGDEEMEMSNSDIGVEGGGVLVVDWYLWRVRGGGRVGVGAAVMAGPRGRGVGKQATPTPLRQEYEGIDFLPGETDPSSRGGVWGYQLPRTKILFSIKLLSPRPPTVRGAAGPPISGWGLTILLRGGADLARVVARRRAKRRKI
ncbi:hypothetical protein O3P69_019435 [Scylla paramamosain]|uniref:Pentraxin (PTX) domain-containing protein n=1 Tax=Scylla paramamosain TaxID=85552 RepID=A0AAW0SXJ9_SCYPA